LAAAAALATHDATLSAIAAAVARHGISVARAAAGLMLTLSDVAAEGGAAAEDAC